MRTVHRIGPVRAAVLACRGTCSSASCCVTAQVLIVIALGTGAAAVRGNGEPVRAFMIHLVAPILVTFIASQRAHVTHSSFDGAKL